MKLKNLKTGELQEVSVQDYNNYDWIWRNAGITPDGDKLTLKDALAVTNAPLFFPKVVENIVKEAMEPLLIGTSLLQRINHSGFGQTITFPAVGAINGVLDIGEGQEYPEVGPSMGASTVTANIGKVGIAVKVTEEMRRYSQFDVLGMMLRKAGQALARHKEQKIFNMISALGSTIFDNVNPGSSLKGVLTGRDLHGTQNGSLTMDDLFDCFAHVMMQGFMPNTVLMHPLTWTMFIKDPVLRAFALANGGGTFFANWTGSPSGRAPWDSSSQGGLGVSPGQGLVTGPSGNSTGSAASGSQATSHLGYPQDLNSAPVIPSYFNLPMRIIVSPFVKYNAHKKLTDIYMFDSNELGAYIVDEEVTTEEFSDPSVDMTKIKVRERYGLAILNEGHGVGVMRNVHLVPNELVLPAQTTVDVSGGQITTINPLASVL